MKPTRINNQESQNVFCVSKPCCNQSTDVHPYIEGSSIFHVPSMEKNLNFQINRLTEAPCHSSGGFEGRECKGGENFHCSPCGNQPPRFGTGHPSCGHSSGSCCGSHLNPQDSRIKVGSNRPFDSSFHGPLMQPHLPHHHHHHIGPHQHPHIGPHQHPHIGPHHQLDCPGADVAIAFQGYPPTLLMTSSDGASGASRAPPLDMMEPAVEVAFAEREERYQLNQHHSSCNQPPWAAKNNTRANNTSRGDDKTPQGKRNGVVVGRKPSPPRREKFSVPEARKGPAMSIGSNGNLSRIVVGDVKNGKNITDDVKGKLSHPQSGPFRVNESESSRSKHPSSGPAKSRVPDDYEVLCSSTRGRQEKNKRSPMQFSKDHSADEKTGNSKAHSVTCPRNPTNLAQAHELHKKVLAEFTKTHARRNVAGNPKNNKVSSFQESKDRLVHSEALVKQHNGKNTASSKFPEVKIPASSLSSHSCIVHPHEPAQRVKRSGTDMPTCENQPPKIRPKEPDPIRKNNNINKCDYRGPPWRSSQSRLNVTERTSHSPNTDDAVKAEVTQRYGRSRSTWRTGDTGRSGASSPYRRRFASSDRSSHELRLGRPLESSTVRTSRPKRRSESTSRFPLPATESRPLRSRNQLSELFENSLENSTDEQSVIPKVVPNCGTTQEHVYDTIESCGCHKYAMDRIDSILKNSGKSVLEISAANYDVPRSTKVLPSSAAPVHLPTHKINTQANRNAFSGPELPSCLCPHLSKEKEISGSKKSPNPDLSDAFNSGTYDSDSSATYASIDTPTELEANDKKCSTKLSTLDIKEDRRRTPDIVKCSREPHSVDQRSSVELQQTCCQCRIGSKGPKSASGPSEKDSDLYQDISPPSTVIHMPLGKRLMEEKFSSRSTGLDRISSGYSGSRRDLNEITQEDEIYSVVEEWPSDGKVYHDKRSCSNANSNSPYFPHTVELPETRTDTFSNKYITSLTGFSTLDPLKNQVGSHGQVSGSPVAHSDMPGTTIACGNSSRCYGSHCSSSSPNVRVCTSVKELCSLMGSDANTHVYVYKVNPGADGSVDHRALQQTPHTVFILPRMPDGASSPSLGGGAPGRQECPCTVNSSATPRSGDRHNCCQAEDATYGTTRTTKDDGNGAGSVPNKSSKKQAKKEGKMTLFQKLRRAPTVMGKNSKKAALNNNSVADQSKPNNGSPNNDEVESEGVTFVEPDYEHQNSARYDVNGAMETSLRFDYSSSWQNLLHFKQMSAAVDG